MKNLNKKHNNDLTLIQDAVYLGDIKNYLTDNDYEATFIISIGNTEFDSEADCNNFIKGKIKDKINDLGKAGVNKLTIESNKLMIKIILNVDNTSSFSNYLNRRRNFNLNCESKNLRVTYKLSFVNVNEILSQYSELPKACVLDKEYISAVNAEKKGRGNYLESIYNRFTTHQLLLVNNWDSLKHRFNSNNFSDIIRLIILKYENSLKGEVKEKFRTEEYLSLFIETEEAQILNHKLSQSITLSFNLDYPTTLNIYFINDSKTEGIGTYELQVNTSNTLHQTRINNEYFITELNPYIFIDKNISRYDLMTLLEKNVRYPLLNDDQVLTFVKSILTSPEHFFFKNNGIVANVERFDDKGTHIDLVDLKVLNGGQTISIFDKLYYLCKKGFQDLTEKEKNFFSVPDVTSLTFSVGENQIEISHEKIIKVLDDLSRENKDCKQYDQQEEISKKVLQIISQSLEDNIALIDVFHNYIIKFIIGVYEQYTNCGSDNTNILQKLINYKYLCMEITRITVPFRVFRMESNKKDMLNDITVALNNQKAVKSGDRWSNDLFVEKFNELKTTYQITKRSGVKQLNSVLISDVVKQIYIMLDLCGTAKSSPSSNVNNLFENPLSIIGDKLDIDVQEKLKDNEKLVEILNKEMVDKIEKLLNIQSYHSKFFEKQIDDSRSYSTLKKYGQLVIASISYKYGKKVTNESVRNKIIEATVSVHKEMPVEMNPHDNNFFKNNNNCNLLIEKTLENLEKK